MPVSVKTMRPKTKADVFKVLRGIIEVDRQLGRVLTQESVAKYVGIPKKRAKNAFDIIRGIDRRLGEIFRLYHNPNMVGKLPVSHIEAVRKRIAGIPESAKEIQPVLTAKPENEDDTPDENLRDQISFDAYECVAKHGELTAEQVAAMTGHPLTNVAKELKRLSTPVNEFDEKFQMIKARVNDRGQTVYSHGLKNQNNNKSSDASKREIKRYRADSQAAFKTKYKAMKPVRRDARK